MFAIGMQSLTGDSIYRCFKLMWIFPVCCLLFTVGFVMREFGAFDYGNLGGFIVSQMFIYFSP